MGYISETIWCRRLLLGGWCRYATSSCDFGVTFDLVSSQIGDTFLHIDKATNFCPQTCVYVCDYFVIEVYGLQIESDSVTGISQFISCGLLIGPKGSDVG